MFKTGQILLGQYRPTDSFLHSLDTRAKMLPVTLVLVLALLTDSYAFYTILLAALIGGLLLSGVTAKKLLMNLRPMLILVLITAGYHLLFSGQSTPVLAEIIGIKLTTGAVEQAAFFSLRLLLFVSMAFMVTLTSSPSELADAFAQMLSPLSRLRVPVQDLALILFMAIRFIPVLYEEFETIRNAQIIRGVSFSGSMIQRIRKTLVIIIPVFVVALQRADELALAIEARGYNGSKQRTQYSRSWFKTIDFIFMIISSVGVIGLYYITR